MQSGLEKTECPTDLVKNLYGPFSSKSYEIILNQLAWALIWAVSTC